MRNDLARDNEVSLRHERSSKTIYIYTEAGKRVKQLGRLYDMDNESGGPRQAAHYLPGGDMILTGHEEIKEALLHNLIEKYDLTYADGEIAAEEGVETSARDKKVIKAMKQELIEMLK